MVATGKALETLEKQHFTFLWYLISKFIIYTNSGRLAIGTKPMALTLYANVKSTLATIALANNYRLMNVEIT